MPMARSTSPLHPVVLPASMLTVVACGSAVYCDLSRTETVRTWCPAAVSRSLTAAASVASDPVVTISIETGQSSTGSIASWGTAWRDRIRAVGPLVRSRASRQASAVCASSAGRGQPGAGRPYLLRDGERGILPARSQLGLSQYAVAEWRPVGPRSTFHAGGAVTDDGPHRDETGPRVCLRPGDGGVDR